ncbi:hybrid sensor histidine kinase/response regulator [Anabaena cylindrica UHCC 0172]|uniref:ATP-binding response regulator n=1 Tax=Anabaena cylindrica TaxID=1165 RepID=UPI002B207015|nr:hybrid sensor histidine kinase/response regulator [Anabaena cylindrica]MEA5553843.1 hybrid sensor histidine kinase/response regulator [Anabaena cylindrica UHCC 0172]
MTPFSWNSNSTESILLVDDSTKNVCLLKSTLKQQGYRVTVTDSDSEALIKIAESPPDLVLLDTFMPKIDGYEIARQIKQNSNLPFIPILLITNCDESKLIQGLQAGADDFLIKPVEQNELLARVRSLLRLKHSINQRDQIARQRCEDFMIKLTHDLRTPLTSAIQLLQMIQKGNFGYNFLEIRKHLQLLTESNQTLLSMVENMLEVYQYETGCKDLEFFLVDLWELAQKVVRELKPLAVVKNLALNAKLNNTQPSVVKVRGDRIELYRLLTNLIGNAIRFTDAGSVEIRLSSTVQGVKIEVEDTGIGISRSEKSLLFERFRQGKHQRRGSGLGLYLSCQIVEAHQGNISVSSTVGKGSIFTVYLPKSH